MYPINPIRYAVLAVLVALALFSLSGCVSPPPADRGPGIKYEYWDHVIRAEEFSAHPSLACLVYRYEDSRFDSAGYFDMRALESGGVSDFDSVFDAGLGQFLYQPVYTAGSVTWLAHAGSADLLAGTTLRFYRIWQ